MIIDNTQPGNGNSFGNLKKHYTIDVCFGTEKMRLGIFVDKIQSEN